MEESRTRNQADTVADAARTVRVNCCFFPLRYDYLAGDSTEAVSLLKTATATSTLPLPSYSDQDRVFARAFDILRQAIADRAFPGAAVAVTHAGKLVALKGLGRFTHDAASPEVTAATVFDLASVSKVVATTAMAMILYERGHLDLEAPVAAVLPEFASADDPRRRAVIIRMLLAHSSGLPAYARLFETAGTRDALL
ncbi:MAG: serine hydrolase domain-containing protein, partial [Terriglobales bacterium]